ncbi:MAG: low-specificity L-threonine aldolase [bacterium]|nr:low-specificity L-threonine aldolase [bacterium]
MSERVVELRSDTFTLPDAGMREAMARAELGDDVFGEDPTVNRLQELSADLLGKEAALFVPSGSMANLVSLLSHCERGDEIYLGDRSHIFIYEAGSSAAVGGLHPWALPNADDGTIDPARIEDVQRTDNCHFPRSRLLCLENTHNRCNGSPLTVEYLDGVLELAGRLELTTHLDGARLFNAATALGVSVKRLARGFDSLSFCLSKGLGAPVGSLVCGTHEFIARALRMRKQLGGGMRQAGVLAAAGLYALDNMVDRLADDHVLARRLAEGIAAIDGLETNLDLVRTNIVFFDVSNTILDGAGLVEACRARGVHFLADRGTRMRIVTHFGLERDDIDYTLSVLRDALAGC